MKREKGLGFKFLAVILLLVVPTLARGQTVWMLKQSTLTYRVTHPLHEVQGISHAARGKGECQAGVCNFLIAVPVKSFASGDTNRDLHMLQIVRGAQFPMVVVRGKLPEAELKSSTVHPDFEIQFSGQTAQFKQVLFHLDDRGDQIRLTGTIPAMLTDFKIPAPELLFVPIKNQIPVTVDMTWEKQKK